MAGKRFAQPAMHSFYQSLVDLHYAQPHLARVLMAGTLVSTTCGALGCFIVLRRMAFLGDALAHSMLAGVTAGYLIMKLAFGSEANAPAMLVGSLVAGFVTAALIGWVSRVSRIKEDATIGIMYTGIFALGGLLASLFSRFIHVDLLHFITGNVLAVELADLWMVAAVAVLVWAVIILLFRQLQLTSFDPVMAASIGVPVALLDHLLTGCTSLVVVSGVNIVGVILVVGLLVTPAATAYLLSDRLQTMIGLAALFGWTSFMLGYFAAVYVNVAPGSAIVVAATLQFLAVLVVAPRYGLLADWWRRRSAVGQRVVEDILGWLIRAKQKAITSQDIARGVSAGGEVVRRTLQHMEGDGLVRREGTHFALTEAGQHEARRLVRSHRLWEAYLEHVGTPAQEIHGGAHKLEHVHDEEAVDYLDDKLGHPLVDPHGEEIPEDFVHLVPGAEVKASLLRAGRSGEIVRVEGPLDAQLSPGETITAGSREAKGDVWTFTTNSGRAVRLDHRQADQVVVRLIT
jgi:manganese/iron transport system permease protein/iron/zinc/copper transport system permease protein